MAMKDKPFTITYHHVRLDLPAQRDPDALRLLMASALREKQIKLYRRKGCYYMPRVKAAVMCQVQDNLLGENFYGYSFCSASENFVTKRGRAIARGRAMRARNDYLTVKAEEEVTCGV